MHPEVDAYLNRVPKWQQELRRLRKIILGCGLTEEWKWKIPCYTVDGKNVVGINGLKESCALAFFKGALLKDPQKLLAKPGENSQAGRWIKFTNVRGIARLEPALKAYIHEAVEVEKAGLKVRFKKITDYEIPEELQRKFAEIPGLKAAFRSLTPGRQRAYLLYFSAAKRSMTREARVEKSLRRILDGVGLNEMSGR